MPLSDDQRRNAQLIYGIARSKGVPHERAVELVAAANAESGLNPNATNRSSGAAGFFQLLSSGYRTKAQQLGGLYNPRANTLAILPDYMDYWKRNPNAAVGAAARDVERSGMGTDFYDDVGAFSWLRGGGQAPPASAPAPTPAGPAGTTLPPSPDPGLARQNLARELIAMRRARSEGGRRDISSVMSAVASYRQALNPPPQPQPAQPVPTGPAGAQFPAQPMPTGKGGSTATTMLALIQEAQRRGLVVRENPYTDPVDPVHTDNSHHYRTFPGLYGGRQLGRGADISGSPSALASYFDYVRAFYPRIPELIYDPRGSVFDGTYSRNPYGGHGSHVHVGL